MYISSIWNQIFKIKLQIPEFTSLPEIIYSDLEENTQKN